MRLRPPSAPRRRRSCRAGPARRNPPAPAGGGDGNRASRSCRPPRVEPPVADEVGGEIRVGQRAAAEADDRGPARGDHGRADAGTVGPEPGVAGADDGDLRGRELDLRGDPQMAGHAFEGMLVRDLALRDRPVEGPAVMRLPGRDPQRQGEEADAGLGQLGDERLGLGEVDGVGRVGVHAEAEREGDEVGRREPAGHEVARRLLADAPDRFEEQTGPVLERAAVAAVLPVVGGQGLGHEIAVAGLDIDAVEAGR